jgi:hypothetical protein
MRFAVALHNGCARKQTSARCGGRMPNGVPGTIAMARRRVNGTI